MLRRFVIASLAAALALPAFTVTPASAKILTTCSNEQLSISLTPGLSHQQTSQTAADSQMYAVCFATKYNYSNITVLDLSLQPPGHDVTTFPTRPLGCPVTWGGAGPDYPNQTPLLFGADPSFQLRWEARSGGFAFSYGSAKFKAATVSTQVTMVLNITEGLLKPPAGKKTRVKGTFDIAPHPSITYTCADDSDPIEKLELTPVGHVIVNQK